VVDAYAQGSALADAIRMLEWPDGTGGRNGDARWADIQRRVDDFDQTLYGLRASAPGEPERGAVIEVITNLQAVRSVMEARQTSQAHDWASGRLHGRLQTFEASWAELRDDHTGVPGS
jgi:hypothetical protein